MSSLQSSVDQGSIMAMSTMFGSKWSVEELIVVLHHCNGNIDHAVNRIFSHERTGQPPSALTGAIVQQSMLSSQTRDSSSDTSPTASRPLVASTTGGQVHRVDSGSHSSGRNGNENNLQTAGALAAFDQMRTGSEHGHGSSSRRLDGMQQQGILPGFTLSNASAARGGVLGSGGSNPRSSFPRGGGECGGDSVSSDISSGGGESLPVVRHDGSGRPNGRNNTTKNGATGVTNHLPPNCVRVFSPDYCVSALQPPPPLQNFESIGEIAGHSWPSNALPPTPMRSDGNNAPTHSIHQSQRNAKNNVLPNICEINNPSQSHGLNKGEQERLLEAVMAASFEDQNADAATMAAIRASERDYSDVLERDAREAELVEQARKESLASSNAVTENDTLLQLALKASVSSSQQYNHLLSAYKSQGSSRGGVVDSTATATTATVTSATTFTFDQSLSDSRQASFGIYGSQQNGLMPENRKPASQNLFRTDLEIGDVSQMAPTRLCEQDGNLSSGSESIRGSKTHYSLPSNGNRSDSSLRDHSETSVMVSNAGLSLVNGLYEKSGQKDGAAVFTRYAEWNGAKASINIFRSLSSRGWSISIVPRGCFPGSNLDIVIYTAHSPNPIDMSPPSTNWESAEAFGQDPPPILIEVKKEGHSADSIPMHENLATDLRKLSLSEVTVPRQPALAVTPPETSFIPLNEQFRRNNHASSGSSQECPSAMMRLPSGGSHHRVPPNLHESALERTGSNASGRDFLPGSTFSGYTPAPHPGMVPMSQQVPTSINALCRPVALDGSGSSQGSMELSGNNIPVVGTDNRIRFRRIAMCIICRANPITHVFVPCGHPGLCGMCAAHTGMDSFHGKCPVGRCPLDYVMKIYGTLVEPIDSEHGS